MFTFPSAIAIFECRYHSFVDFTMIKVRKNLLFLHLFLTGLNFRIYSLSNFDYKNISKLSQRYAEDRFKKEFEDFVNEKLNHFNKKV